MLKLAGELVEGQLAEHIARLDAHTYNPLERLTVGNYYPSPYAVGYAASNVALAADKIYAVPFPIARKVSWDRIAIEVQTLAAGKSARLGIYKDNGSLYPGDLYDDAGEVSVATTGVKAITISYSSLKGLYWLVIASEGTPNIYAWRTTAIMGPLGFPCNPRNRRCAYQANHTYGALPATFPVLGKQANYYLYAIGMRVASLD